METKRQKKIEKKKSSTSVRLMQMQRRGTSRSASPPFSVPNPRPLSRSWLMTSSWSSSHTQTRYRASAALYEVDGWRRLYLSIGNQFGECDLWWTSTYEMPYQCRLITRLVLNSYVFSPNLTSHPISFPDFLFLFFIFSILRLTQCQSNPIQALIPLCPAVEFDGASCGGAAHAPLPLVPDGNAPPPHCSA